MKLKNIYFAGAYIAFGVFLVSVATDAEIITTLSKIIALFMICIYLFSKNDGNKISLEKSIIIVFLALFNCLLFLSEKIYGRFHGVLNVICSAAFVFMAIVYLILYHKGLNASSVKSWLYENGLVLLIILSFALMSLEVIDASFMWDSQIYYSEVKKIISTFNADFTGIYDLYLAGHASLGYSFWIIFFQMFKEGSSTIQIANIILAVISIFSYYQILRKLLGSKFSNKILALATVPYAFSPFVLGMVGNLNVDSPMMYFMIMFLACSLYGFEALELIFIFCFCFTKEPAIIYYTAYIIFKVIFEYMCDNTFNLWKLTKAALCNTKNYLYMLPVILWKILYTLNKTGGLWDSANTSLWNNEGMTCFGISANVVSMKLMQIFFLNFNWIFWCEIILGVLLLHGKNRVGKEQMSKIGPLCFTGIVMMAFGCIYVTWVHARYICPLIPIIYLTATVYVSEIKFIKASDFTILNAAISILLLVQCFYVVDPVMKNVFDPISVGNTKLYSLQVKGNERIGDIRIFHDSIVYNRQYNYWQDTLKETLDKSGYDESMLVVLPSDDACDYWSIFGNTSEFNIAKKGLVRIVQSCKPNVAVENMASMNTVHCIYISPAWAEVDISFISGKKILRQGEVSNKGYNLKYWVMEYIPPLSEGTYIMSAKQDGMAGLETDGNTLRLGQVSHIDLLQSGIRYDICFNEHNKAMDVPEGIVDENGSVRLWEKNDTESQKYVIEEVNGYYMICWNGYALTYDLNDNTVKLAPKTGDDNQLWQFEGAAARNMEYSENISFRSDSMYKIIHDWKDMLPESAKYIWFIDFTGQYSSIGYNATGLSTSEGAFAWTDGNELSVSCNFPEEIKLVTARINIYNTFNGTQNFTVYQNNTEISHGNITGSGQININLDVVDGVCNFNITLPNAISPYSLDMSEDRRVLSLALSSIEFIAE